MISYNQIVTYNMISTLFKAWFCTSQILTIPPNIIISLILRLQVTRPPGLKIKPGTLIIANHQSKIDPFLITYHLGWKNLPSVLPVRYPVLNIYMCRPILGAIIRLLGGYDIGSTALERLRGLARTRSLLKRGYSVLIFPEGKINYTANDIEQFKRGAEMLFSYNYPVLFVRLCNINGPNRWKFWRKHEHHQIIYSNCLDSSADTPLKIKLMMNFYGIKL